MGLLKDKFEEDGIKFSAIEKGEWISIAGTNGEKTIGKPYHFEYPTTYGYDVQDIANIDKVIDSIKAELAASYPTNRKEQNEAK